MNGIQFNPAVNYKPTFKGKLGDAYAAKIIQGEKVEVANVMSSISGTFGPKKDKAIDVIESLVSNLSRFVGLNRENTTALGAAKRELSQVPERINSAVSKREQELYTSFRSVIAEKDQVIAQKDKQIESLKKYEGMAKVKSIDEIGLVMPEQVLATIEEMKAHDEEAHRSLFEYVMTGKGQKAFLAQMERNSVLLKADKEGMFEIPELKEAFESASEGFCGGYNSAILACDMLQQILCFEEKGTYLHSPAVYNQVKTNAETLILPMKDGNWDLNIGRYLDEGKDFHTRLATAMTKASEQKGLTYKSETRNGYSVNQSYRTFVDKDGNTIDYPLSSLASGMWGMGRVKNPEGVIFHDWSKLK